MTDPTVFADWANAQDENIRKSLQGAAIVAPFSAAAITSITTGAESGLIELPAGYKDVGWLTSDGVTVSSAITTSDITAWGTVYPVRSDITKRTTTIKIVAQETNAVTVGLYSGKATSAMVPDPTTGEVWNELPLIPANIYYRLITIGVDTTDDGEFYVGKFFPRVKVTDLDDQAFADGDDPLLRGLTFTTYPDSVLGYAEAEFIAGPAAVALASQMGFDDSSS